MKKLLAMLLAVSLTLVAQSAQAATVTMKYKTSFTASTNSVWKMKKSGCQTFPIQYRATREARNTTAVIFMLETLQGEEVGGAFISFMIGAPYGGTARAKVCREGFVDDSDNIYVAAKNGTYYLRASLLGLDADTTEVKIKITN